MPSEELDDTAERAVGTGHFHETASRAAGLALVAAAACAAALWPSTPLILLAAWIGVIAVVPLISPLNATAALVLRVLATPVFVLALGASLLVSESGAEFWAGVAATVVGVGVVVLLGYELRRISRRHHGSPRGWDARHSS